MKSTEKATQRACTKCKETKPETDFYRQQPGHGSRYMCKSCILAYQKNRLANDPSARRRKVLATYAWRDANRERYLENHRSWASSTPSGIYQRLKRSTLKHDRGDILSRHDFLVWYCSEPYQCAYCDIPGDSDNAFFLRGRRLTIDRRDSSKGYITGNLALACQLCNSVKLDVFSFAEMRSLAQLFIKPKYEKH